MIIDTLRPIANAASGAGWNRWINCPSPTTTTLAFWEVLSDNDPDTRASNDTTNNQLRVNCGTHTPAANHERHMVRVRTAFLGVSPVALTRFRALEIRDGQQIEAVAMTVGQAFPNCDFYTRISAYVASANLTGAGTIRYDWAATRLSGGMSRISEAYIDIDSRARPSFVADVLDGAGTSQDGGVITDTSRPLFVFDDQELDGLPARSWRAAIYAQPTTVAPGFDPFVTPPIQLVQNTGPASVVMFNPIPNGDYVIFGEISTTIRTTDPFVSNIESVDFEIDFPPPDPPANLTATVTDFPPSIEVCWEDPEAGIPWDEPTQVVAELFRIDCNGTARIATIGDGLTACWVDRFFGLNPEPGCEPDTPCNIQYQVRYWGYSNGVLVTTEFTST